MKADAPITSPTPSRSLGWMLLCLGVVLFALFARSFDPTQVLFSNDGPLGGNSSRVLELPAAYTGMWTDLNWIGGQAGSAFPSLTYALLMLLKPVGFAKFYAPICLLVLGLSAWLFFRQLGFRGWVAVLGGLAAALNTDFFSYACWGLGTLALTIASAWFALAALVTPNTARWWLKAALAGCAVGMAVMEGFDNGAIFSLYLSAFVLFQAWIEPGPAAQRLGRGVGRVALVAVVSAFLAAQALTVLIGTQVKGVVGMEQDAETKAKRWAEATQWSLPKIETSRVVISGLFGYRMDSPDGGVYWGTVGETPGVPGSRFSGAGFYAGVLVVLLAAWGFAQACRKQGGPFTEKERRFIWFWTGVAAVSLLLAFGKFAPFYQVLYALPYFSTIRNPVKFMHPFSLALVILFAYALHGLSRRYLEVAAAKTASVRDQVKAWWRTASTFDQRWTAGSLLVLGAGVLGELLYGSSRHGLEQHLQKSGIPADLAPTVASFSLAEAGWFLFFLTLGILTLTVILSGALAGRRSRWAVLALGLLLVGDLARANRPWIVYWNYREKYATNPVIELLRDKPYEHRVQVLPFQVGEPVNLLLGLYNIEWVQHLFQYYNIQSLDVIQESRTTADNAAFRAAFPRTNPTALVRLWQLTNTRYLLGMGGGFVEALNQQLDPVQRRFRIHTSFAITPKHAAATRYDELTAALTTNGPLALLEFTGALPRAKLYTRWETGTNGPALLQRLADPAFDPAQAVLVDGDLTPPATNSVAKQESATVEIISYAPKVIQLKASTAAPAVLLLNDKFDPDWHVTVDGQPQTLLRCNFLMRGVAVPAGTHQVEFRFQPRITGLYVSLAALGAAAALLGLLAWDARRAKAPSSGTVG